MKYITGFCFFTSFLTVAAGLYFYFNPDLKAAAKKMKAVLASNAVLFIISVVAATAVIFSGNAHAAEAAAGTQQADSSRGLGFIAAALATGIATIGAGYAVGSVGSSALGAVSEDPKILGKTLIFVGLAEGIAIYGLIVSILILGRL